MENSGSNHININDGLRRKVTVRASEILSKFKTKADRQAFCKESSK